MIRLLASLALSLLSNAIGLLAAAVLVSGFSVDAVSFVVAVLIFSASTTILGPLIAKIAFQYASYLMGGIALVTIFAGLVITSAVSNGIQIEGWTTWVVATLVVWLFSVIGSVVLPLVLFKQVLGRAKNSTPKQA